MKRKAIITGLCIACTICSISLFLFAPRANAEENQNKIYKSIEVKQGDSLWDLSDRYRGNKSKEYWVNETIFINHLTNDGNITAGNFISVPVYPVKLYIEVAK